MEKPRIPLRKRSGVMILMVGILLWLKDGTDLETVMQRLKLQKFLLNYSLIEVETVIGYGCK